MSQSDKALIASVPEPTGDEKPDETNAVHDEETTTDAKQILEEVKNTKPTEEDKSADKTEPEEIHVQAEVQSEISEVNKPVQETGLQEGAEVEAVKEHKETKVGESVKAGIHEGEEEAKTEKGAEEELEVKGDVQIENDGDESEIHEEEEEQEGEEEEVKSGEDEKHEDVEGEEEEGSEKSSKDSEAEVTVKQEDEEKVVKVEKLSHEEEILEEEIELAPAEEEIVEEEELDFYDPDEFISKPRISEAGTLPLNILDF